VSSTRRKIEKTEIEGARQRLLEAIYSELPDDRFPGREAVKQLLGTLIAARERGLPFERIAEILQQADVELSPSTLRRYFFELKTDAGLAADSIRHSRKVAQTRDAIRKQVLERHTEHANELAAMRAHLIKATPQPVNAFSDNEAYSGASNTTQEDEARTVKKKLDAGTTQPALPAAPLPPPVAPEAARFNSGRGEAAGIPMTLTAIEAASRATEERTALLDDVELRDVELVFYVSGQPFYGFLSQRQIRLLRTVGKIIAPTRGQSTKDFVSMPTTL
jgi:DNA-binding transcriptional MerR regulator